MVELRPELCIGR